MLHADVMNVGEVENITAAGMQQCEASLHICGLMLTWFFVAFSSGCPQHSFCFTFRRLHFRSTRLLDMCTFLNLCIYYFVPDLSNDRIVRCALSISVHHYFFAFFVGVKLQLCDLLVLFTHTTAHKAFLGCFFCQHLELCPLNYVMLMRIRFLKCPVCFLHCHGQWLQKCGHKLVGCI